MGALTPVRAGVPADGVSIGALAARAWRSAYAGLLAPDVLDGLDAAQQGGEWHAYLSGLPARDRMWVTGAVGAITGFARTGPCQDPDVGASTGEVHGLYVDPDRIGTGLGHSLFQHAVADLHERHAPVVVWHFAGNDRAARFYERAGFRLDGAERESDFGVVEVRRRATV
ncbi:MAG TPA: GNAT family N-acetyltransferase [Gaiellales bacterium]